MFFFLALWAFFIGAWGVDYDWRVAVLGFTASWFFCWIPFRKWRRDLMLKNSEFSDYHYNGFVRGVLFTFALFMLVQVGGVLALFFPDQPLLAELRLMTLLMPGFIWLAAGLVFGVAGYAMGLTMKPLHRSELQTVAGPYGSFRQKPLPRAQRREARRKRQQARQPSAGSA